MKNDCKNCKHFEKEDGMCDGCSNTSDESCYCHLNPPCGICENNHFELKIKCDYCGNEIEEGQEIKKQILINHSWREKTFCSGNCAGYAQMSAEG